ncbi:hypothetical protein MM1S1540310_3335 [Mycobacteroides abscessus subsp. bolletii 1S-154-0310]|uniref:Transmembrane protein n=1 Tax=Mycobacteroides abscessus subsp. bolletii CRM-0020 TaxID=1306401 RepID=A0A829HR98_9MYCO|nr:hypothetical protein MYCMA_05585 [Mycobacteroides abscessus subsp. massiliense str. GO 06]EHC00030.1 hypothetical protein MAB47J26_00915 [Mycobacteroides abscessus 47J26]EIU63438.1 hypothetical protein MM1S1510930_3779 [Mycobacteroides abscessus subsp. bolletii 1S-151-0930]EIU68556.1 hypothetical protein MM1S1520914_3986 [Mycobacteroides abscessus subsp. bolletii 1S-152-0914]EIU74017.1 hypothetical protein MM1S1530915_3328 [Mycobacteroides abscessus subsp. bolletii 1S-153-0915]EIU77971.1 hy
MMTRDKTFRVVRAVGSGAWWVYVVGMLTAVRPFGGGWRFMSVEDLELFGHGLGSSRSPRYAEYLHAGLDGPMILAQLAGIVVIAAALAEVAVVRPWIGLATVVVSCASLALVALVMRPPLTVPVLSPLAVAIGVLAVSALREIWMRRFASSPNPPKRSAATDRLSS